MVAHVLISALKKSRQENGQPELQSTILSQGRESIWENNVHRSDADSTSFYIRD